MFRSGSLIVTKRVVLLLCVLYGYLWLRAPIAHAQARVRTTIVSNVELVRIPIIVFDDKGAVATDLKKSDFRLFEDGVEQQILGLGRERVAVSFIVLADVSSSMVRKIPFVREAALSLLAPPEPDDRNWDEYSVLSVSKHSNLLVPFTRNEQDLEKRLPVMLTATNESTALFDGVWLGVDAAEQNAANQHCAMILITDGGDNHSRYNLRETRKMLEEADVPVFAVMAGPSFELPTLRAPSQGNPAQFPGQQGSSAEMPHLPFDVQAEDYIGPAERRGPHNMKILAEASGGGVFTARREEDLARIVRTIGLAVRYRYVLTYEPVHEYVTTKSRKTTARVDGSHEILLQLYPKDKFAGYSLPYYKRSYRSSEDK